MDSVEVKSLETLRSFDVELVTVFNHMHLCVYRKVFNERTAPNQHTSEAHCVEFLFRQTNQVLDSSEQAIERSYVEEEDEGIKEDIQNDVPNSLSGEKQPRDGDQPIVEETDTTTDRKGIPGWNKVDQLAHALLKLRG